ncbi:MAG: helix-turn-helix transcriptional regulator [Anaerolineae bacterium]|nr:helix-turn-helix transcriptional regulator [Anaerolineae bacterium]
MNHNEYVQRRRQDPEYIKVEQQLKPLLDLANDVIRLRTERSWTQKELAQRVGTRQANISRLENGLANPTFRFLQKLSEVFEVDLTLRMVSSTKDNLQTSSTARQSVASVS